MNKTPENSVESQETPEYSFKEGTQEVLKRILKILENQNFAVVAFNSTSSNVGKTELAKKLKKELELGNDVYVIPLHGLNEDDKKRFEENYALSTAKKVVIILEQAQMRGELEEKDSRDVHNKMVAKDLSDVFPNIKKIDLWVGLYRPDRPFFPEKEGDKSLKPLADIIIRNEFAKDK